MPVAYAVVAGGCDWPMRLRRPFRYVPCVGLAEWLSLWAIRSAGSTTDRQTAMGGRSAHVALAAGIPTLCIHSIYTVIDKVK